MADSKVYVTAEEFKSIAREFTGRSGWKFSNGKGSFNLNQEEDKDPRRKLRYGNIVFVEKVDTPE